VVLGELREDGDDARVDLAGLQVGDADRVELEVLVLEQLGRLGRQRAAGAGLPELAAGGGRVGDVGGRARALP
jgi:hypothetical protein